MLTQSNWNWKFLPPNWEPSSLFPAKSILASKYTILIKMLGWKIVFLLLWEFLVGQWTDNMNGLSESVRSDAENLEVFHPSDFLQIHITLCNSYQYVKQYMLISNSRSFNKSSVTWCVLNSMSLNMVTGSVTNCL